MPEAGTSQIWYPRSDSNRHWTDFKSVASAIGLRGLAAYHCIFITWPAPKRVTSSIHTLLVTCYICFRSYLVNQCQCDTVKDVML